MKLLIPALLLTLFVSCSKKETKTVNDHPETQSEEVGYDLPQVGFRKTIALNYRLESIYENMTLNPSSRKSVPGVKPFVLIMHSESSFELYYYPDQDLKKLQYIDYHSALELTDIKSYNINILSNPKIQTIDDPYRVFTFGKSAPDSPEQDFAGKVFIAESESADMPYISNMKVMFWLECEGGLKWKSSETYNCPSKKLKFNYKLLDFKLTKTKA